MIEGRPHPAPARGGAKLTLRGVAKNFGDRPVLDRLDMEVEPGSFVSIVGRSGGGKSTLLRLMAGLETPDVGTVAFDGQPIRGLNPETRIMFQDARLLPWERVIGNVGITRQGNWRRDALAALQAVGLDDRAGDWPAKLSGGQRQRVALARALVGHPRLVLFDEPLSALDALTRSDMQRLIEQLWLDRETTADLVTHDVAEAVTLSDRVLVLQQGRIALDLAIDLPRPRPRTSPAMAEIEARLLNCLLHD